MRNSPRARKGATHTTHFADDKPTRSELLAKSHAPDGERPLHKLKKQLCIDGERSGGGLCRRCESPCNFGIEYIKRKDEQE